MFKQISIEMNSANLIYFFYIGIRLLDSYMMLCKLYIILILDEPILFFALIKKVNTNTRFRTPEDKGQESLEVEGG